MYNELLNICREHNAQLIVVSKNQPLEKIKQIYDLGHRDFGENRVQNLLERHETLPKDIRWHLIGHLQTNKVKHITPFIHMIHSVDSIKLWHEINKYAELNSRIIPILLQVKIAKEESKHGFTPEECLSMFLSKGGLQFQYTKLCGLMGMATLTLNDQVIQQEFKNLYELYKSIKKIIPHHDDFREISMGMSSDFKIALEEGSTMIRIGSALFESIN
jgi:PLP dependent protein